MKTETRVFFVLPLLLCVSATLTGCTSMRVTGDVTDATTGDIVGACGINIGPKYVHTDTAGHFVVNARKSWNKMELKCAGYETQTVAIDSSQTRYPKFQIRMQPRRTAAHGAAATEREIAKTGMVATGAPGAPTGTVTTAAKSPKSGSTVAESVYEAPPTVNETQAKE